MPSLFYEQKLSDYFETVIANIHKDIESLPEGQFIASSDEEIINHIFSKHEIIPLKIFEDAMRRESDEDAKISYRDDKYGRTFDGVRFHVKLPFTGDYKLWYLTPSRYVANFPEGIVQRNEDVLTFDVVAALDQDPETSNKHVKRNLEYIKPFIDRQKEDIKRFNASITDHAKAAISARRKKLSKRNAVVKAFNVPLKRSVNAPDITHIPINHRIIKPLRSAQNRPQEYGISDDDYEHILKIIRHEGATYESTPETFKGLDEEKLRNIILAHLNGHYQGDATGETFRKSGKTDIRIEFKSRAAFVGECKVWRGEKEIIEAIDQLTGYLTWRDCKTAIVIFNKDIKGFNAIQRKVPEIFKAHKNYLHTPLNQPAGEWRFAFKSKDDEERHVTVHVFLFDLYIKK